MLVAQRPYRLLICLVAMFAWPLLAAPTQAAPGAWSSPGRVVDITVGTNATSIQVEQITGCGVGGGKMTTGQYVTVKAGETSAQQWLRLFALAKDMKRPVQIRYASENCTVTAVKVL